MGNNISGAVPSDLGSRLSALRSLRLANNNLSGSTVPTESPVFSSLPVVLFGHRQLCGLVYSWIPLGDPFDNSRECVLASTMLMI